LSLAPEPADALPPFEAESADGRARVVLERLAPEVDAGRFAAKRVVGEPLCAEVDAFTDGHDRVAVVLHWRHADDPDWREQRMAPLVNDRWAATFVPDRLGRWQYRVQAWIDRYGTWLHDLARRPIGDRELPVWFAVGAALVTEAAASARGLQPSGCARSRTRWPGTAPKRPGARSLPRPRPSSCSATTIRGPTRARMRARWN
jgi:starch synthase (maltosyl-transferring)